MRYLLPTTALLLGFALACGGDKTETPADPPTVEVKTDVEAKAAPAVDANGDKPVTTGGLTRGGGLTAGKQMESGDAWMPDEGQELDAEVSRAKGLVEAKKSSEAITVLDARIKAASDDADAWYWRGRAKQLNKEMGGAETDFRKAVELDPNWFGGRQALANLLVVTKRCGDALALLTQQVDAHPELGPTWANRGFCKRKTGDRDGGLADLEKSCELKYDVACDAVTRIKARDAKKAGSDGGE